MESLYTALIFIVLLAIIGVPYWIKSVKDHRRVKNLHDKSERAGFTEPATLHPQINLIECIGCGSCVRACPEDVLGIVGGRATVVHGMRCVGHAVCADACPVGAIIMGFGKPKQGMEIPHYDEYYETNIPGLYIVGELGGVGLIKNAFAQSRKAIEHIASQPSSVIKGQYDVIIIGGGPAGIGAALAAKAHNLRYVVFEQYDLGGSVLHYPRQKLVLTSPVDLPLYGKIKVSEISKEQLLDMFTSMVKQFSLNILTQQKVESISMDGDLFRVRTGQDIMATSSRVILALGRRGSPRKLGVPGEDLSKVTYRLIDTESYTNHRILVVGGGDSAIEAAVGLARQKGNDVTISYRRDDFVRLKERNEQRIRESIKSNKIRVVFNSEVKEIRERDVVIHEQDNIFHTLPNDFVFVFAGGELPSEFLKKLGVKLRTEEVEVKVA
jgi:thioredoxin reductase (NADPH)